MAFLWGDSVLHSMDFGLCTWYESTVERPHASAQAVGSISCDLVVVGGGFAGLSAALSAAQHGFRVVVLEAVRLCWSASGRNGGQALPGFGCDMQTIEKTYGRTQAHMLWEMSCDAVTGQQKRIAEWGIDCDYVHGAATCARPKRATARLARERDYMYHTFNYSQQWLEGDSLAAHIRSPYYTAALVHSLGGHLHPLKYGLGLAAACRQQGVAVYEHSPVVALDSGKVLVAHTDQAQVRARWALLAGNCLLPHFAPTVAPKITKHFASVATCIVSTEPLTTDQAHQILPSNYAFCDNTQVLDYFRLGADNSLLFGGGVSYWKHTLLQRLWQRQVRKRICRVFPQLESQLRISHLWGGYVDITRNRAPDFGRIGNNVYYLQGFSGHGVAMADLGGHLVAQALAGDAKRFDVFAQMQHTPFPNPLGLRAPLLALAMLYYRLLDALE